MSILTQLRRPMLALAVASGLTAGLLGGLTGSASAHNYTAPAALVIDQVTSDTVAPLNTPPGAVPYVIVEVGQTFTVDISLYDEYGAPASFNQDTDLTLTSNRPGLTVLSAVAREDETTAQLTATFTAAVNQVALTVSVPVTDLEDSTDPGQWFDVLADVRFEPSVPGFAEGIGGQDDCTVATPEAPVCGTVVLTKGAVSPQVLLSLGSCDTTYAACGSTRGSVVQTLADLTGLYTKKAPATIVMKCDKSLCGTGSIKTKKLSFSLQGNDALAPAPACPGKKRIGAYQAACVDYVQSKRDNAGDTHLYFLFTDDARVSVG